MANVGLEKPLRRNCADWTGFLKMCKAHPRFKGATCHPGASQLGQCPLTQLIPANRACWGCPKSISPSLTLVSLGADSAAGAQNYPGFAQTLAHIKQIFTALKFCAKVDKNYEFINFKWRRNLKQFLNNLKSIIIGDRKS